MNLEFDKLLLEEISDAIIATTPDGSVLYWGNGAEATFGFTHSEALGRELHELIIPSDRVPEYRQILSEAMDSGLSTAESLRRRKDGALIYVDITAKRVCGNNGQPTFVLLTQKDVTQLKVLRDAKLFGARFGSLLESTPDAMVMVNLTGRIVVANGQAEKLFGHSREELRGQLIEILLPERFHGSHGRHRNQYVGQLRARSMGAGLDLVGLRKDGTEFPVEISLSPLQTEEGTLVISAVRDISERKQFERQLQRKNEELQAANEELESFSYSISHDLRAPLRAMAGFARILISDYSTALPQDAHEMLDRIRLNATKLGELIDGLLAFSSLGRKPLGKETVEPALIARRAAKELRSDLNGRDVKIHIPELPSCEADATLLQQVFTNLLSNAIKYTRRVNPGIVEVGFKNDNGRTIYFVRDNGAGFDMQYAPKLFRVFQRLHNPDEFEGTGVGLAIVQRIVQRHGGNVWAEAEVNRGATFYFTLNDSVSKA